MSSIKEYRERVESYETARYITGALRDISAIELRSYRARFEQNTTLYKDLADLFTIITRIAEQEGRRGTRPHDASTLYVAYTSNKHFYGSLNQDVMNELLARTGTDDHVLIIGETGKSIWFGMAKRRKEVSFMSFRDDMPDEGESKQFFEKTAKYGRVLVLYPGWVSVFKQVVEMIDITFRSTAEPNAPRDTPLPQYILEPEIMEMFSFFDSQVRYVLFERLLLETQLSRASARLVRMDVADENAHVLIRKGKTQLHKAQADFANTRLLETFTGYLQWHKKAQQSVR